MIYLQSVLLLLVAAFGTVVVFTHDPRKQTFVFSFFGLLLALLFLTLQAPDVAYSEIVVGSAAIPVMVLVTLTKIRRSAK